MSEAEESRGVRVNDRRRFNPDGTPRVEGTPPPYPEDRAPEPRAEPMDELTAAAEVTALQAQLEAAQQRVDALARALAASEQDREDFKKRVRREQDRLLEVEKGNVAKALLETLDELDLSVAQADDSPLARGIRLILDSVAGRLAQLGVERVPLRGLPFDPNLAEAMDMEVTADPEADQTVTEELRAAWRMGDRVIRPGRVKVAKYVTPAHA